jgi:hypothetical protein
MAFPAKKSKWAASRPAPRELPPILPFIRPDLADVAVGARVATFRPLKQPYYPKRGANFRAHYQRSPLPGEYRCDDIRRMTLGKARQRFWQELGAEAPEKLETLWTPLFGLQSFDDAKEGYLYLATRIR